MRIHAACLGAWLGVTLAASVGSAQDSHYWTLSYGTRATLLGGAVIGSTSDLSATFYNPAAISLLREQGFILSAKVYEYNSLRVEDGAGEGLDLVSSGTSPLPSFIAGAFKIGGLEHHSFAYSILTRQNARFRTNLRIVDERDVLPAAGDESFAGEFLYEQNVGDLWTGLSWSYPVTPKVGVGVTQYLAWRDQQTRGQLTASALTTTGELASLNTTRDFDYLDVRLLWKGGVGLNLEPLTLGLTVTTPGVHLYGSGAALSNTAMVGIDQTGDQVPDPLMAAYHEEDLAADYRSPWSVGLGGSYRFGGTILHASAEWFDGVGAYEVLETSSFQAQTSGEVQRFRAVQELESVLDYGFGVEHEFGSGVSGYASYVMDRSAREPGSNTNVSVSSWDLNLVSFGTSFGVGRIDLVLGGAFSFGSEDARRVTDWLGGDPSQGLGDTVGDAKVKARSYRILFGFSVGS